MNDLSNQFQTMTPIIKIVGDFCNLECSYCFYNECDQSVYTVMDESILEDFIRQHLALFSGNLTFVWHGGEPLLAGIHFFEKIIQFQRVYANDSHIISNHVQTNATLINSRWASFFKQHDFKVGISLDGCQSSHDMFRKNRKGGGSFSAVEKGICVLRKYEIPFGVVQVLTSASIPHLAENFSFFVDDLKLNHWGMNVFHAGDNVGMKQQTVTNEQLAGAWKELTELWIKRQDPKLKIRDIESFIQGVQGRRTRYCTFNGDCTRYFCLNYDGRIYGCDAFTSIPGADFGSLCDQPLADILHGERRCSYEMKVNTPHPDCVVCEWQPVCNGGCTWLRENGVDGKYYYCKARKQMFSHIRAIVNACSEQSEVSDS